MRLMALLLATYLLQCSGGVAQSSTDFISTNLAESYRLVKNLINDQVPSGAFQNTDGESEEYVTIGPCDSGNTYFLVHGPKRRALVEIAWQIVAAERILVRRNFPIDRVRILLREREAELLDRVEQGRVDDYDNDEFEFVNHLNEAFAQTAGLPKIGVVECGGGPLELKAKVEPKGARVYIIPKLFYLFCLKTGVDPNDRDKCDHWFPPIRDGETIQVGGIYKIVLEIDGASGRMSEIDFDRYWGEESVLFERQ